jgi:thiol-disulfide isomerase/thioredoxin
VTAAGIIFLRRLASCVKTVLWSGLCVSLLALSLPFDALAEPGAVSRGGPVTWEVVGTAAQPFELEDLNARPLTSGDLAGKIVLLDFWATWCKPCLQELPELAEYAEQIRDREDVIFLSLNVTDELASLRSFVKKHGIVYPVYSGDELLNAYGVFAFPTKLILDLREEGRGEVRFRHFGFTGLAAIDSQVEAVLAERVGHRR